MATRIIVSAATGVVKVREIPEEEMQAREAAKLTPEAIKRQWDAVRHERNARLKETDWTELGDSPANGSKRAYRQALRDVTNQPDPYNIVWPEDV